jgi:hypothetical protein
VTDHTSQPARLWCSSDQNVKIVRAEGALIPARLTYLNYDCCEFECEQPLIQGEVVSIQLFRMGSIRARVTSVNAGLTTTEFVKECPV